MTKVAVLGLGYVGLPTAAVFADCGAHVLGVDINPRAVETINKGRAHIVEPGLDDLLARVVGNGALRAATSPEPSDVFVIAVPTPFEGEHTPDLRYVRSAAEMIAPLLEPGNLVVLESTSPVGTTEMLAKWIGAKRPDLEMPRDGEGGSIHLAYCPERILPGKVIEEVIANDRVIGGMTPECSEKAVEFYKIAVRGDCHVTNARTAELCKLSENSFRDTNIAFANELSVIADKLGVDIYELISLANRHPRVSILRPGTGVGGHCIAVDPWFIVDSAPEEARLIRTAREVNDAKPHWVVDKVLALAAGIDRPKFACMGLAYKPDVDDLRESPSIEVLKALHEKAPGRVFACEPFVEELPQHLADLGLANHAPAEAAAEADIVVFLTAHRMFHDLARELSASGKTVFDACGLLI